MQCKVTKVNYQLNVYRFFVAASVFNLHAIIKFLCNLSKMAFIVVQSKGAKIMLVMLQLPFSEPTVLSDSYQC